MNAFDYTVRLLRDQLSLGDRADGLMPETPLIGSMPEFDSMAVVSIVASLEEDLGCEVDDDEISADVFATVGTLAEFIESKMD